MMPTSIRTFDRRTSEGRLSYRYAKAVQVVRAAEQLVHEMRQAGKELYQHKPDVVLRLRVAIDDFRDQGGEQWD
jgi:hypothetical protein